MNTTATDFFVPQTQPNLDRIRLNDTKTQIDRADKTDHNDNREPERFDDYVKADDEDVSAVDDNDQDKDRLGQQKVIAPPANPQLTLVTGNGTQTSTQSQAANINAQQNKTVDGIEIQTNQAALGANNTVSPDAVQNPAVTDGIQNAKTPTQNGQAVNVEASKLQKPTQNQTNLKSDALSSVSALPTAATQQTNAVETTNLIDGQNASLNADGLNTPQRLTAEILAAQGTGKTSIHGPVPASVNAPTGNIRPNAQTEKSIIADKTNATANAGQAPANAAGNNAGQQTSVDQFANQQQQNTNTFLNNPNAAASQTATFDPMKTSDGMTQKPNADIGLQNQAQRTADTQTRTGTTRYDPNVQLRAEALAKVAMKIAKRFDGQNTSFTIRLDPAELGRVDVRLRVGSDKKIELKMLAEKPEALTALTNQSHELETALKDMGFDLNGGDMAFDMTTYQDQQELAQERFQNKNMTISAMDIRTEADLATPEGTHEIYGFALRKKAPLELKI